LCWLRTQTRQRQQLLRICAYAHISAGHASAGHISAGHARAGHIPGPTPASAAHMSALRFSRLQRTCSAPPPLPPPQHRPCYARSQRACCGLCLWQLLAASWRLCCCCCCCCCCALLLLLHQRIGQGREWEGTPDTPPAMHTNISTNILVNHYSIY
jgi:hypothetical protein